MALYVCRKNLTWKNSHFPNINSIGLIYSNVNYWWPLACDFVCQLGSHIESYCHLIFLGHKRQTVLQWLKEIERLFVECIFTISENETATSTTATKSENTSISWTTKAHFH